jgi:thiamine transport system substrate-binding protein
MKFLKRKVDEMKKWFFPLVLIILAGILAACAGEPVTPTTNAETRTLTVMTHDSFAVSEGVIAEFEDEYNVKVEFLRSGDTGAMLNKAILSKDNPLADVLFGVDNTFLTRALDAGIFESYDSPMLDKVPVEFQLDPEHYATPIDYGDVCINYDVAYFEQNSLDVPTSLEDLTKPEYNGLLVMENPATSSPGLAFLMASIAEFGQEGYLEFWQQMTVNGLVVVNDWETAYYTNFSGSSGKGPQPMVVSYGSSPAAEVIFAETDYEEAPTSSVVGSNTCFRQIEFAGILKGTPNRDLAEAFIDFMLNPSFQEDIPLQMFVFPVSTEAELPQEFVDNVTIPEHPATLSPELIDANREAWINAWTEIVLQ